MSTHGDRQEAEARLARAGIEGAHGGGSTGQDLDDALARHEALHGPPDHSDAAVIRGFVRWLKIAVALAVIAFVAYGILASYPGR